MDLKKTYNITEVAVILKVSTTRLYNRVREGKVRTVIVKEGLRSINKIPLEEFERLKKEGI